jgi:hypothetical protein
MNRVTRAMRIKQDTRPKRHTGPNLAPGLDRVRHVLALDTDVLHFESHLRNFDLRHPRQLGHLDVKVLAVLCKRNGLHGVKIATVIDKPIFFK